LSARTQSSLASVAIGGRWVVGRLDYGKALEVLRVCTDGTPNTNSFLCGRVRRIAQLMGYEKVIIYTLTEASGASLRQWVPGLLARSCRRSGACLEPPKGQAGSLRQANAEEGTVRILVR